MCMPPENGTGSSGIQTSTITNLNKRRHPSNTSISSRIIAKKCYSSLFNLHDNTDIDLTTSSEGENN
jgi:hypothetical protein